jgi:hypothetical protein
MEVDAMSRTRWLLLAMVFLAGLAPLMVAPGSVGAAPGPNSNNPTVISIDDTFLAPNLTAQCGFDVWAHFVGTITTSVQHNGVLIERYNLRRIFTGPGGSLTVVDVGVDKITETISPDGTTVVITIASTGSLPYHTVVPGHGSVVNNAGHEILQIILAWDEAAGEYVEVDYQVLFDAGPNDEPDDADTAVICAALA